MSNSSIRTAQHPGGLHLEFHPDPHHYIVNGEIFDSVTSRIHQWFPQFDAEATARRKAEREGLDMVALMAQWERKRQDAAAFGSRIHAFAEQILLKGDEQAADHLPVDERERSYLEAVKMALRRVQPAYEIIEAEKIVFSPTLRVAGTIDLLLRSKATGEWIVADWKTNREIKYQGFREERGLGPCADLQNCNYIHYSLQTSAYSELLMGEGYLTKEEPIRGVLFHLRAQGTRVNCEFIKVRDLRSYAQAILEWTPGVSDPTITNSLMIS